MELFFFFEETSLELLLYSSTYEPIDAESTKQRIMQSLQHKTAHNYSWEWIVIQNPTSNIQLTSN